MAAPGEASEGFPAAAASLREAGDAFVAVAADELELERGTTGGDEAVEAAAGLRAAFGGVDAIAALCEGAEGGVDEVEACAQAAERCAAAAWLVARSGAGWSSPAWREAFVLGSCCGALARAGLARRARERGEECAGAEGWGARARAALRALDTASVMGAPAELFLPLASAVAPLVAAASVTSDTDGPDRVCDASDRPTEQPDTIPSELMDADAPALSLPPVAAIEPEAAEGGGPRVFPASALRPFWESDSPVVMRGLAAHWPAVRKWADLRWWTREHGARTVPLELGEHGGGEWREELSTLGDFVAAYLAPSARATAGEAPARVGYMAQHHLLEQLPSLMDDIEVPDACAVGDLSKINAWLGTKGTVSPCHFDSYDNVFVQVCGFKHMRLYPSSQSKYLYRCKGGWKGQRAWPSPEEQAKVRRRRRARRRARAGGGGACRVPARPRPPPPPARAAHARATHPADIVDPPTSCRRRRKEAQRARGPYLRSTSRRPTWRCSRCSHRPRALTCCSPRATRCTSPRAAGTTCAPAPQASR